MPAINQCLQTGIKINKYIFKSGQFFSNENKNIQNLKLKDDTYISNVNTLEQILIPYNLLPNNYLSDKNWTNCIKKID